MRKAPMLRVVKKPVDWVRDRRDRTFRMISSNFCCLSEFDMDTPLLLMGVRELPWNGTAIRSVIALSINQLLCAAEIQKPRALRGSSNCRVVSLPLHKRDKKAYIVENA